jgi:hypothetical protein
MVEAIGELPAVGRDGETEARQVGRHDMESVGKQRNEISEHVRGGGEAVQQQEGRVLPVSRFAIEHPHRAGIGAAKARLGA